MIKASSSTLESQQACEFAAGPGEAGEDEARADATTDMTLGSGD
jgi:hypothetical protein